MFFTLTCDTVHNSVEHGRDRAVHAGDDLAGEARRVVRASCGV